MSFRFLVLIIFFSPAIGPFRGKSFRTCCGSYFQDDPDIPVAQSEVIIRSVSGDIKSTILLTEPILIRDLQDLLAQEQSISSRSIHFARVDGTKMSNHDVLIPSANVELTQISVQTFPLNMDFLLEGHLKVVFQDCSTLHTIGDVLDAWVEKLHEFDIHTEQKHWK